MDINGAAYAELDDNKLIVKKINGKNKEDIDFLEERINDWSNFHDWVLKYE